MPWSRVLEFSDPFPYQAAIRAADVELYPTGRGQFHSELTQVSLNKLWTQRFHEKLARIYSVTIKPGRKAIGFLTDDNQPAIRHCSMDVSPQDIMVCGGDEMHQCSEAGGRYGSMSLATDDLDEACRALLGRELLLPPVTYLVRSDTTLMSRLLELHKTIGQIAKTIPSLFELPEVVRNLEQQLTRLMVRCLAEGDPLQLSAGSRRHDAIIGRLEEFLETNQNRPLYLTEICAALGTAERTLRAACIEHLGMGPIRYLGLRRMHLVRRALLSAAPSTATVTKIAMEHGFWELGRFAVAYRAHFGESPSATLQRRSDDRLLCLNRPSSLAASQ
jgi:AraC-like DNA-binding protein